MKQTQEKSQAAPQGGVPQMTATFFSTFWMSCMTG
jgi:hypothetical protein